MKSESNPADDELASATPAEESSDVLKARDSADLAHERNARLMAAALLVAFLGMTQLTQGLRSYHLALVSLIGLTIAIGGRAFRFLRFILPCILTGIIYDYFRLITGLRGEIHIADIYGAELALFGVTVGEGAAAKQLIPADFLLLHTRPFLDLTCGLVYILYLYVPILSAVALFFLNQRRMLLVGWSFFATNMFGMVIYLAYPAAPPWYVAKYGLGPAVLDALPSAAGAARFDQLIGFNYFTEYYKRSANVFGAMPSLHCGYPMSTLLAMWGAGKRWVIPLGCFSLYVSFAAIYLQHHYILDVLAGALTAICGFFSARWFLKRSKIYRDLCEAEGAAATR